MRRPSMSVLFCGLLLLPTTSCIEDPEIQPSNLETSDLESEAALNSNAKGNKIILVLVYEKSKEKIEVNRNQETRRVTRGARFLPKSGWPRCWPSNARG